MHGDFSRWLVEFRSNDHGLLHQQGKVLLDQDINAAAILAVRWQLEAARAAFGGGVVAVPPDRPASFQVQAVRTDAAGTWITVGAGHAYCDGALAYVGDRDPVEWRVTPTSPPPAAGTRQVVMLECWHETRSAFQEARLMEPALGGPDTSVRAHLAMALRLVTLGEGQDCGDARIDQDTGGLTVALDPPRDLGDPDCPIEDAGGYRGINHHQYRVEIAESSDGTERYKWSRYNGGLVGTGRFTNVAGTRRLTIRANQRAIATSGLTSVYVEALAWDDGARGWYLIYGARGTLANDHEIDLAPTPLFGADIPGSPTTDYFVRIWDGCEPIGAGGPHHIGDGINLTFTGGGPYPPDSYWSFAVRAGLPNPSTILSAAPAHGPGYLRAPLASFTWGAGGTVDPATISDCRAPFQPLTRRDGCCTIRVGDGVSSHGDVTTLQAAIDRLPEEGGTICVLPGVHRGLGKLRSKHNVTIHGCGWFSVLTFEPPSGSGTAEPVIHVSGGSNIRIENLAVLAHDTANGILVTRDANSGMCRGLVIERVFASGAGLSAIDVDDAMDVLIRDCDIAMADRVVALPSGRWPALTLLGVDCRVEKNRIRVAVTPTFQIPPNNTNLPPGNSVGQPNPLFRDPVLTAHAGLGGMWLRGGCDHVTVLDNRIESGIGHGIILGHIIAGGTSPGSGPRLGWIHNFGDPCEPCADGSIVILPGIPGSNFPPAAGPPLARIVIEGNEIISMGQSGIGVYGFFTEPPADPPDNISVAMLRIVRNHIFLCLNRGRAPIAAAALGRCGYGAIALATVHDLDVDDNRIEFNGVFHDDPACALYVHNALKVRVTDNVMELNGRHAATATAAQGARGGVYLERIRDGLTVHGNLIAPLIGHAIRAVGEDFVAVTDNRLTSKGANNVNQLVHLNADGRVLTFNDNTTDYDGRELTGGTHAIELRCDGSISFADNHGLLRADQDAYVSHVHLTAQTVRMSSNRLQEIFKDCVQFSGIVPGVSTFATVMLNQCDHCLAVQADAAHRISFHNFEHGEIDPTDCKTAAAQYFDPLI